MDNRLADISKPSRHLNAGDGDLKQFLHLLRSDGHAFASRLLPELSIREIAVNIGPILDPETVAPNHGISTVQKLSPRASSDVDRHSYSGVFGLDDFPLHSDYAHWNLPPRFLVLRCLTGSPFVSTYLLNTSAILDHTEGCVARAVVVARRSRPGHKICTMPVCFQKNGVEGLRWDFLFLHPANQAAKDVGETIRQIQKDQQMDVCLCNPGDTLIVDNWRMLHGRSAVPTSAMRRQLERIYISELWPNL
ncbi:hypothetical protein WBQ28_08705 [Pseudomonas syringae pv. syringae]|uniref:hypothetical protein n=1 Tax=Pseudomonas syringae TaxID=317 RepID=UPI003B00E888